MSGRILLVGKRREAAEAASRLGYEPVVHDQARQSLQALRAYGGTPGVARAWARETFADEPPRAVVAVAEGAVPAAAQIRADFGLDGLGVEAAARCHDKLAMKRAAAAAGVPCAPWLATTAETTADEIIDRLGLPVLLKVPVSSGGRGVRVLRDAADLAAALGPGLLAEGWVDGVEMSVESLVAGGQTQFRNHTRYLVPRWASIVPAALDAATKDAVDALSDGVHAALGIDSGMSHLELFITESGPVFSEVAARPPGGRLMELMRLAYDFDPWEALVRNALGERPALPPRSARAAGVWLLHPGAGVVTSVAGVDAVGAMPGVVRARVAVSIGEQVSERLGSGQSVGEIVVTASDHEACAHQLQAARDALRIDVAPAGD